MSETCQQKEVLVNIVFVVYEVVSNTIHTYE